MRAPALAATATLLTACGIAGAVPPDAAQSTFGPGTYRVGTEIQPGDYTSPGPTPPAQSCYWARLDDVGTSAHLVDHGITIGPAKLTVQPSDQYVSIAGCTFTRA